MILDISHGLISIIASGSNEEKKTFPPICNTLSKQPRSISQTLSPQWVKSVDFRIEDIQTIAGTLLVSGDGSVATLHRSDGALLWIHSGIEKDMTEGEVRKLEGDRFRLIGVSTANKQSQIAVILHQSYIYLSNIKTYESISSKQNAELLGINLSDGKELWHNSITVNPGSSLYGLLSWEPVGVYGETIILHWDKADGDSVSKIQLMNSLTGINLNVADAIDLKFLQKSATLYGHTYDWPNPIGIKLSGDIHVPNRLLQINSRSKQPFILTPIAIPGGNEQHQGAGVLLGKKDRKIILMVITDDGATGHSSWPNYLLCLNSEGKTLWFFPDQIIREDVFGLDYVRTHYDQLNSAVFISHTATIVIDSIKFTYFLNANTGKTILKRAKLHPNVRKQYKSGYLEINANILQYKTGPLGQIVKIYAIKLNRFVNFHVSNEDIICTQELELGSKLQYYNGSGIISK